jgi:hypothetical protein
MKVEMKRMMVRSRVLQEQEGCGSAELPLLSRSGSVAPTPENSICKLLYSQYCTPGKEKELRIFSNFFSGSSCCSA